MAATKAKGRRAVGWFVSARVALGAIIKPRKRRNGGCASRWLLITLFFSLSPSSLWPYDVDRRRYGSVRYAVLDSWLFLPGLSGRLLPAEVRCFRSRRVASRGVDVVSPWGFPL